MGIFIEECIAMLCLAVVVSSASAAAANMSGGSDLKFDIQGGGSEVSTKYSVKPSGYDNKIGVALRVSGQGFRGNPFATRKRR